MKTKGTSYYQQVQIQTSAKEGPQSQQVDRKLADLVKSKLSGPRDGRISTADALEIANAVADGGKYGKGEQALVKMLWRATDDRFKVSIDGQRVRITDPGEKALLHELRSFFGTLGAKAAKDSTVQTKAMKNAQAALNDFAAQLQS